MMNKQFIFFLKNFRLFLDIDDVEIEYGKSEGKPVSISRKCEDSFWLESNDINRDDVVWKEWAGVKIPFLFEKENGAEIITFTDDKAAINYDIVASAFYFLSGWNEYVSSSRDQSGRVTYRDSIINELNIPEIPVVNYYFNILEVAVSHVYKRNIKRSLWGANNLAVCLTHDIDTCRSCWLEGSFSELKKKRFLSIPKLIFKRILTKDDWFNFKEIAEIEEEFNATSSFYFLPRKGKSGMGKNADYNIQSKSIQNVISFLKEQKKEVGVHGSFGSHTDEKILQNDIRRINSQSIIGNRFHFLMFDPGKTVDVLEKCDLKYDTSLSFAEHIGFRRGSCYPFYLYNFEKDDISSVVEIPLIVMDTSLSSGKYMRLDREEALQKVCELMDETEKFNGVFTLLWHNTSFSDYKYTGWRKVYIDILAYGRKKNGLLTNGKDIYERITGKEA